MKPSTRKKLEEKGFNVGTVTEFLELTPEDEAYLDFRAQISEGIRRKRKKMGWTQRQLAQSIGSDQSRIARLENGDPGVSLDLMVKALIQLGTTKRGFGELLEELGKELKTL